MTPTAASHFQITTAVALMDALADNDVHLVADPHTVMPILAAAAPTLVTTNDVELSTWLDTVIHVAGKHYATPVPRGTSLLDALACRYATITIAAATALIAAAATPPPPSAIAHATDRARSFLEQFPHDRYPLIPGDALTPRAEYRDALQGAMLLALTSFAEASGSTRL